MSVNRVILVGNVGRKPELRYVEGRAVATFSLATSDPARTLEDGRVIPERTEWHEIVMWDRGAETAERYVDKGTKLYIEGKLRTRQWQDRNAITRRTTEVVVERFDILSRTATPATPPANKQA